MLVTCIPYLIIQGSAFALGGESDKEIAKGEQTPALVGLILCVIFFLSYLIYQLKTSGEDEVLKDVVDELRVEAIRNGTLSVKGAFFEALRMHRDQLGETEELLSEDEQVDRFSGVLRKFFKHYDKNNDEA